MAQVSTGKHEVAKKLVQKKATMKMKVDIWSDMMCPFCYIGKRHYEEAVGKFADSNDIELVWHSYQLDPSIKVDKNSRQNPYKYLAEAKGISYEQSVQMHANVVNMAKQAGLIYDFDKAVVANSLQAHRVVQMAKTKGLGDVAEERFFDAYFTKGRDLADAQTLIELGQQIGLTADEVNTALTDNKYLLMVQKDLHQAEQLRIQGVPYFVFNNKFAVSGAQHK